MAGFPVLSVRHILFAMNIQISWNGSTIDIFTAFPGYIDGSGLSEAGHTYVKSLLECVEIGKGHAAAELLESYNTNWINDSNPVLTESGFRSRLRLGALELYDEAEFATMFFADDDMFGGHNVVVDFEGLEPNGASLVG